MASQRAGAKIDQWRNVTRRKFRVPAYLRHQDIPSMDCVSE